MWFCHAYVKNDTAKFGYSSVEHLQVIYILSNATMINTYSSVTIQALHLKKTMKRKHSKQSKTIYEGNHYGVAQTKFGEAWE